MTISLLPLLKIFLGVTKPEQSVSNNHITHEWTYFGILYQLNISC